MPRAVFLAAPERGHGAHALVEALLRELQVATGGALKGSDVFAPHLQVGDPGVEVEAAAYFSRSLRAIQDARVVVAVLDGAQVDESVAFWMGYAFAAEKPVLAYVTDARAKGPMVSGAVTEHAHDVKSLAAALARRLL
jgi:nucleoside 2-deoxyribosyltransferase